MLLADSKSEGHLAARQWTILKEIIYLSWDRRLHGVNVTFCISVMMAHLRSLLGGLKP